MVDKNSALSHNGGNNGTNNSTNNSDVGICAILLAGLLLRLTFLIGAIGSDDTNYFHFSQLILHWQHFTTLHHHGGRLFFLIVAGVPAALFGSVNAGAVINILLASLRDIVVVLYLRRRVGSSAALSAAGILVLNTLSIAYSGLMLPDVLLSLMMFIAAALAFESINVEGKRRLCMLAGSGFCAWAAYSAKDTGILIIPCIGLWLLMVNSRWRSKANWPSIIVETGVFLSTFIVFILLEMFVYYLLSGDPLYRVHALAFTHNTNGDVVAATSLIDFVRRTYWNFLAVTNWQTGSLPVLAVAAVIWFVNLTKKASFAFFSLTGAFLAAYLIFGTSSFSRLIPLPVQDRYFEILIPFIAVAAAELVHLGETRSGWRRFILRGGIPLIVGLISVPAIVVNAGDLAFSNFGRNSVVAIHSLAQANPGRPIYVSQQMHWLLETFLPPDEFSQLKIIPENGNLPSGFYLLDPWKDMKNPSNRTREVLAMPTYITIDEDHRTFSRFLASWDNIGCTVRYFDGKQSE